MNLFRQSPKRALTFFPWIGEVHDGHFQRQHIRYSEEEKIVSFTVWRPEGAAWRQPWRDRKKKQDRMWEGLTIVATGVDQLDISVTGVFPFFELSTVYAEAAAARIVFECHYGIDVAVRGAVLEAKLLPEIIGPKSWHEAFE